MHHLQQSHGRPGFTDKSKGFRVWLLPLIFLGPSHPALSQSPVRAQAVSEISIEITRSVPAVSASLRMTTISSQISAAVVSMPVRVGDSIQDDEIVAELDCVDSELTHAQAQADLDALTANRVLANQQLGRLNKLRLSNNASEEAINQKQAELNVVSAQIQSQRIVIEIAARQIEKCTIRAPYTSIVTHKHAEQGDFVTPGSPLLKIVDNHNVELKVELSEEDLRTVSAANSLTFIYQQQEYPVRIRSVPEVVNSTAQTRELHLEFTGQSPLPGSVGRLNWQLQGNFLPASLAVRRQGTSGIFTIDTLFDGEGIARFHALPHARPGRPFAIDLGADTLVITDGRFGLKDGDSIVLE